MELNSEMYVTWDLFEKTNSKLVKNWIDRDFFDIVIYRNCWWIERGYGMWNQLFKSIKKEMKRIYPSLKYIYEDD